MANTQYKRVALPKVHKPADPGKVSWPAELKRAPFGEALASQDSIFNGVRCLMEQHTGGSLEWLAPDALTADGFAQANPDAVTWRTVARGHATLAAGCSLEMRVLAVPSGPAIEDVGTLDWELKSKTSHVKVTIDYEEYGTAEVADLEVIRQLATNYEEDAAEDPDEGAQWGLLDFHYVPSIRPLGETTADMARWSEWPTVNFEVAHRGGVRLIHLGIWERPWEHAIIHSEDEDNTIHGYGEQQLAQHPTEYPQTKFADGATYNEERFGTFRGLWAADRQVERCGPMIACWSSYAESTTEVADTEADPKEITSTTYVGVSNPNLLADYASAAAGFDFPAMWHKPGPHNHESRLDGNAAVVPVRVWVYARFTTDAGTEEGTVQFQTTERSMIHVTIPEEDTWRWYTTTGFLEGPVNATDTYCILHDKAKVTGGTMQIRAWSMHYGAYEVAS